MLSQCKAKLKYVLLYTTHQTKKSKSQLNQIEVKQKGHKILQLKP